MLSPQKRRLKVVVRFDSKAMAGGKKSMAGSNDIGWWQSAKNAMGKRARRERQPQKTQKNQKKATNGKSTKKVAQTITLF